MMLQKNKLVLCLNGLHYLKVGQSQIQILHSSHIYGFYLIKDASYNVYMHIIVVMCTKVCPADSLQDILHNDHEPAINDSCVTFSSEV